MWSFALKKICLIHVGILILSNDSFQQLFIYLPFYNSGDFCVCVCVFSVQLEKLLSYSMAFSKFRNVKKNSIPQFFSKLTDNNKSNFEEFWAVQ